MMIFIEEIQDRFLGKCWEISTESWDGAIYMGKDKDEAIKRFEEDKGVKATKVCEVRYVK